MKRSGSCLAEFTIEINKQKMGPSLWKSNAFD